MKIPDWMLALTCSCLLAAPLSAASDGCLAESRIPIVLKPRSGASAVPIRAYLVGSLLPELRILDASNGRLIWSAGATSGFTQQFRDMTAGFTSSLSAIDIDGDGVHDRIYAGDLSGRLWRFDLQGGASPRVTGGVFADLGDGVIGRGFLAAPDITLMAPAVGTSWLSIAIGTANTTPATVATVAPPVTHRFFILRDREPLERWTQQQYDRRSPLVVADLALIEGETVPARAEGNGFYINLGTDQVIAPALTIDGRTTYTVANTTQSQLIPCGTGLQTRVAISVGSVSATDGSPAMDLDGDGSRDADDFNVSLQKPASADAAIALTKIGEGDGDDSSIHCTVSGQALPGCSLDTSLHRSFWRREDAD